MNSEFPFDLRKWQARAYQTFLASGTNCLISATPGSGKTIFALKCIHSALVDGDAEFVVIVVPSDSLKDQWQREASKVGIELSSDVTGGLGADYDGIVTTYAALGQTARVDVAYHVGRRRTISVLDEPHHLGTSLNWSDGTTEALSKCTKRLLITGTPFRSDDNPIPYVEYTDRGDYLESICDFTYGYGDALRDGVVRPVYFETFDGLVTWFKDEEEYSASVSSEIGPGMESDLRRHTLDARGNWMKDVLTRANEKLIDIRSTQDARAGGLVITANKYHADKVADEMKRFLGFRPLVVVSNDDGSISGSDKIDDFRESDEPWIVAVKMVSEGVDIKRLRVEVYATNIKTELFFRQANGRIVRVDPLAQDAEDEQSAYMFIPKWKDIQAFAEQIKEERTHAIDDIESWMDEIDTELDGDSVDEPTRENVGSVFVSSESEYGGIVHDGENFSPAQIEKKRQELRTMGLPLSEEFVLGILRYDNIKGLASNGDGNGNGSQPNVDKPVKTLEQHKHEYTRRGGAISRRVAQLIEMSNNNLTHGQVNGILKKRQGLQSGFSKSNATLQQCKDRVAILDEWIKKGWLYYV